MLGLEQAISAVEGEREKREKRRKKERGVMNHLDNNSRRRKR